MRDDNRLGYCHLVLSAFTFSRNKGLVLVAEDLLLLDLFGYYNFVILLCEAEINFIRRHYLTDPILALECDLLTV